MVASITINPINTSNALGSFNVSAGGLVQGVAFDDPATRYALKGGYLDSAETLPMWGGVGISTIVPTPGSLTLPNNTLGAKISRATAVGPATSGLQAAGLLTGFSVFDQDHSMIQTPESPVPLAASYMGVNYYALGSRARIALAIDPVLANLEGVSSGSLLSWDFSLQRVIPYVAGYAANVLTALTRALVGGVYVATATTTSAHGVVVGDDFTITGETPAAYNGTWTAIAGTTGSTLVYSTGLTVDPGASTVQGTLVAGGGAVGQGVTGGGILPVRVLDIDIGNSMTVSFDPVTGFATWNRTGSAGIFQI